MSKRARSLSLSHILFGITALLVLAFGAGLTFVLQSNVRQLTEARENHAAVLRFAAIFHASNRISAERGPSNVAMSIEPGSSSEASERLAAFRADSDRAIDAMRSALAQTPDDWGREITDVVVALDRGRSEIDRIAGLPLQSRSVAMTSGAAEMMMAAVDLLQPILSGQRHDVVSRDGTLLGPLMLAQAASDLREYAGRIGSYVIPFVIRGEPISDARFQLIEQTRGRILHLVRMMPPEGGSGPDGRFGSVLRDVNDLYLGSGLALIGQLAAEGRQAERYSVSPDAVTQLYVPTMAPLETLRNVVLEDMVRRFQAEEVAAVNRLYWGLGLVGVTGLAVGVLLLALRDLTVRPLLAARQAVIHLSEDRFDRTDLSPFARVRELTSLSDALMVLAGRLRERHSLLKELRLRTEVDPLTGVMSRQHFETAATDVAERATGADFGLLYLDIDHFKSINDTFGHHVGDALLAEIGARLRRLSSPSVLIGRLGGDEFAISAKGARSEREALARMVTASISQIRQVEGRAIVVSCSVGLSVGEAGPGRFGELCRQADAALYLAKSGGRNRFAWYRQSLDGQPIAIPADGPDAHGSKAASSATRH